jgi:hypothetical protein
MIWTNVGLSTKEIGSSTFFNGYIFMGTYGDGIYRSSDNGNTWIQKNNGLTNDALTGITYFTGIGSYVFACTFDGIFRSNNNGDSWTQINTGLPDLFALTLINVGGTLYAGTENDISKSTDNGDHWTPLHITFGPQGVSLLGFHNNIIFAGTFNVGLFRSLDGGTTWIDSNTGMTNTSVLSFIINSDYIFVGGYGGLFRSNNDGISWQQVNNGFPVGMVVQALTFVGNVIFVGSFAFPVVNALGVYVSYDNGDHWAAQNTGLTNLASATISIVNNYVFNGSFGNGVYRGKLKLITSSAPSSATEGVLFSYQPTVSDTTSNTWSLTGAPSDLLFNTSTGSMNWTPQAYVHAINMTLSVSTSDTTSLPAYQGINLTVGRNQNVPSLSAGTSRNDQWVLASNNLPIGLTQNVPL